MSLESCLYMSILFVGAILLVILYTNSIFLYKQKITDRVSKMLLFAVVMSLSEIIWSLCEGIPGLRALTYAMIICYCVSFTLFASLLNRYLIERIGLRLNKGQIFVFYQLPISLLALVSVTTPLTGLLCSVDEAGVSQYGPFMLYYFLYLMLAYLLSSSIIGVYFLTLGKRRRPAGGGNLCDDVCLQRYGAHPLLSGGGVHR